MSSFTGEYRHSIDAKGRLIVPSRLRPALEGDQVVLTRWLEVCIAMWSGSEWERFEASLREQGSASPAARRVTRYVAASAHVDVIDKQGRITVPQHLRQFAGIDREVVVSGALTHGEIWNPDRYAEQQQLMEEGRLEELARELNF